MNSKLIIVVFCLFLITTTVFSQKSERNWHPIMGAGIVISPGYNDTLKEAYKKYDISGGWGWLDLQLGVRYDVFENLSVTPGVDLLANYVIGTVGADSFVNTIILPSIAGRYLFKKAPSLYISGEVNYGFPNSGGKLIDIKSGGIGCGGFLGYAMDSGGDIEGGYQYIPVKSNVGDENWGGFELRFRGAF